MTLRVLEPGLSTWLVDYGRPSSRSLGVPVGGAADRFSLALGNALVGNPPNSSALEMTLAGPTLQADCDLACVVYGAPFDLICAGQDIPTGHTFTLHSGEILRIAGTRQGVRAYLCVRGGFRVKAIMGSRSGFQALSAGIELPCTAGVISARFVLPPPGWNQEPKTLRALPGPQADWFPEDGLLGRDFTVTPDSNRMGLRLHAEPLPMPARELVSEPVCPGTVQVTSNGQCIVLGVEGQTIGGYPKIAQVISADVDKLGQLRPDDRIRFQLVSGQGAVRLYRQKQQELGEWLTRLGVAEVFVS
jgi:antagonist of KipI